VEDREGDGVNGIDWPEVTAALSAAVAGRGVSVVAQPDMRGAMVAGRRVDVYLVPTATGISVECWRKSGSDPYKIVSVEGLDDAVRLALGEM